MSSGNMPRTQHPELFQWSDALDPADYLHARYRVGSIHDGEATALAMAMEQSAATTHIRGHVTPAMLQASTAGCDACTPDGAPAIGSCAATAPVPPEAMAGHRSRFEY